MADQQPPPPEPPAAPAELVPEELHWGPGWSGLARRALFEVAIVVVGVLIALGVDQMRINGEHRAAAVDARRELGNEIRLNRARLLAKLRTVSAAASLVQHNPETVSAQVAARRNLNYFLFDTAWTAAVQTDAVRWLTPAERATYSDVYQGQALDGDVEREETDRWTALAAFGPNSPAEARDEAIRVWLAYADRVFLGTCRQLWRYEEALGTRLAGDRQHICETFRVGMDPSILYRAWGVAPAGMT